MTVRFPLALAALLCCLSLQTAGADEPRAHAMPKAEGTPATIFSFGRENPTCTEWTNACQVCTRSATGEPQCSTAGIACTPGVPVCKAKKAP